MVIDMGETRLRTIEQLQNFLSATPEVAFTASEDGGGADNQRHEHISRLLARFDCPQRNKRDRGVVLACLRRTTGYGRAQLTRLVGRCTDSRVAQRSLVKRYRAPAAPFARKYTAVDLALLVEMDRAHEDVCGAAIAHLLQRAHTVYGDQRYERLADLSVSHLHNLRKRADYQAQRVSFVKTRAVCNSIGLRQAPSPNGRAGYGRGMLAAGAGFGPAAVPVRDRRISLRQRHGVHQRPGGQVAAEVARRADQITLTPQQRQRAGDRARMPAWCACPLGYSHIPQRYAKPINAFYQGVFNPWLNLHRPCMFASEAVSPKGKVVKRYRHEDVKTPLAALNQLCGKGLARLKEGVTLVALQAMPRRKPIWLRPRKCNAPRLSCSDCSMHLEVNPRRPPEVDSRAPHASAAGRWIKASGAAWEGGITHEYMCVIGGPQSRKIRQTDASID